MPTDDERRAVARRLRRSRSEWSGMGWRLWLGPKFCAVVLSDGNRDELEDAAHRLADLIEPSCDRDTPQKVAEEMFGKMRHSTKEEADAYDAMLKSKSIDVHPVDRDALLALAEELEEDACWEVQSPGVDNCAWRLKDVCDRIREALGVSDD